MPVSCRYGLLREVESRFSNHIGKGDIMKQWILAGILAGALATPAAFAASTNVAQGATVRLDGTGFGDSSYWGRGRLAAPESLTDGLFLDEGHQWNLDTVFWNGAANNFIIIDLGTVAQIESLTLQADNNDTYLVQYLDGAGQWQDLAYMQPPSTGGVGTKVLPSLPTPVMTDAFRIGGYRGDNLFAVSEFQAFAPAVPEPATSALLLAGLGAVSAFAKRRKQRA